MRTSMFLSSALAMALVAMPTHAQILGGGGIAGGPGGALGGGIGGTLDSGMGGVERTVRSTTGGAIEGRASSRGETSVDRRSGRVRADRGAEASAGGNASQFLKAPVGGANADAQGSGSASGNGSASAQLVGTDAVRGAASNVRDTATSQTAQARGKAQGALAGAASSSGGALSSAGGTAGGAVNQTARGNGQPSGGAGAGSASGMLAGSGAANGKGTLLVSPGTDVLASDGRRVGEVGEVVADERGQVREVLVETREGERHVPAGDFSAAGDALMMGSGRGEATAHDGSPSTER